MVGALAACTVGIAQDQAPGGWRHVGDPAPAPPAAAAPNPAPSAGNEAQDPTEPVDRSDQYGQPGAPAGSPAAQPPAQTAPPPYQQQPQQRISAAAAVPAGAQPAREPTGLRPSLDPDVAARHFHHRADQSAAVLGPQPSGRHLHRHAGATDCREWRDRGQSGPRGLRPGGPCGEASRQCTFAVGPGVDQPDAGGWQPSAD